MGGRGSGNIMRWGTKRTAEDSLSFDIRLIYRKKLLVKGTSITSTWSRNGNPYASIGGRVYEDHIMLHYTQTDRTTSEKEDIAQRIDLTHTDCNYGGQRSWLRCPDCQRRVAVIYHGGNSFSCRKCKQITYSTCNESGIDRMFTKANKIRERLGAPAGSAHSIGDKPKGMHWNTFFSLSHQVESLEQVGWIEAGKKFGIGF